MHSHTFAFHKGVTINFRGLKNDEICLVYFVSTLTLQICRLLHNCNLSLPWKTLTITPTLNRYVLHSLQIFMNYKLNLTHWPLYQFFAIILVMHGLTHSSLPFQTRGNCSAYVHDFRGILATNRSVKLSEIAKNVTAIDCTKWQNAPKPYKNSSNMSDINITSVPRRVLAGKRQNRWWLVWWLIWDQLV